MTGRLQIGPLPRPGTDSAASRAIDPVVFPRVLAQLRDLSAVRESPRLLLREAPRLRLRSQPRSRPAAEPVPGAPPGDAPWPTLEPGGDPPPQRRSAAESYQASPGGRAERRRLPWSLLTGAGLAWLVTGLVLFSCFLHMSRAVPVNSDGAANALQAWAMLHGDPLLRGWVLSDVSFYTTELPQYVLIELIRGLSPDVVHVAAATTYTFVVLLAARLAKGEATGTQGVLRAFLAAGIMMAPQKAEVTVLMLSPDHVGSTVPVLLMWLLIDRAGRRWYVPVIASLLLGLALVADEIVLLTGIAPLVLVALVRAYQRVACERGRIRSAAFELGLVAAGAAGAEAGWHALALISSSGGFYVWPPDNRLVGLATFPHNLLEVYQGTLLLFGANFMAQRASFAVAIAMIHVVGIGLAGWALCAAIRRFPGADIATQLMVAAILISLAAFALGPNASELLSSREFAAVLPFGAALAGRTLAARLSRASLVPALIAVLAVYVAGAVRVIGQPPAPAQNQALASWLTAHRLCYGLAGYWLANSITLDSGGTVAVRALKGGRTGVWPEPWESEPSWYSPAQNVASFVVLPSPGPGQPLATFPDPTAPTAAAVLNTFGQPSAVYFLTGFTVLVWNKNLLSAVQWPPGPR